MNDRPDLFVDLLDQDQVWIDARGETHQVGLMPTPYVRRVVAFLEQRAGEIEFACGVREALLPTDLGDMPDDVSEELVRERIAREKDPVAWLRATPLMKRFRGILADTEEGAPW